MVTRTTIRPGAPTKRPSDPTKYLARSPRSNTTIDSRSSPRVAQRLPVRCRNDNSLSLEALAYRQIGADDKDCVAEPAVLRLAGLVEHAPRDEHGHDDRLAGARGHLQAVPGIPFLLLQWKPRDLRDRALHEPDRRLDHLQLAEEEGRSSASRPPQWRSNSSVMRHVQTSNVPGTVHMISTISGTIVVIVPPCMTSGG